MSRPAPGMSDRRERRLARWLLVAVAAAAVLPLAAMRFGPEPYPTLAMPNFGESPLRAGMLTWRQARIVAVTEDGSRLEVKAHRLLPRVKVIRSAIIEAAFLIGLDAGGRPLELPRPVPVARRVLRGVPAGMTVVGTPRAHDPRTVAWLRTRLRELIPDRRVVEVQVVLEEHRTRPGRTAVPDRSVLQVVSVPLGPGR